MTPEEIAELKEIIELYRKADIFSSVMLGIAMLLLVAWIIVDLYRVKKVKETWKNYYITLNDDQKEVIRKYREIK